MEITYLTDVYWYVFDLHLSGWSFEPFWWPYWWKPLGVISNWSQKFTELQWFLVIVMPSILYLLWMTHSKTDNISNSCSLKLVIENDHYLSRFSQAHNIFLQDNEHFQATKTYIQRDYNPWTVKPMLSLLRKYVLVTGSFNWLYFMHHLICGPSRESIEFIVHG